MQRLEQLLQAGVAMLTPVVGDDAQHEAMILLGHATGRQVASLRFRLDDSVEDDVAAVFNAAIAQRCQHQPIAQIIGRRAFWKDDFIVTPDVLDPRPDTETLVEQASQLADVQNVLDLGTGSGCVLLSVLKEFPEATGVGIDVSEAALGVARRNADALDMGARARFQIGDWCAGILDRFDLVVSNPPYITADAMLDLSPDVLDWEPRIALTPEGDGLDAYRAIVAGAAAVMKAGGHIMFEIGYDQGASVASLLRKHGFRDVTITQDINGKDRVVQGRLP